jgi:ferredoxin/flavodoxin---NADP+ reductase
MPDDGIQPIADPVVEPTRRVGRVSPDMTPSKVRTMSLLDATSKPAASAKSTKAASGIRHEIVQSVTHWTDRLFSFTTTRGAGFRFRSGQFTMIGVEVDGRPLMRAYSIASAAYDNRLEFFSIKVPDGPLTSRLQHLEPGMEVLIGQKPTGTLILDGLSAGRRLYLLGTGTGVAPFASIVHNPETYERFESVALVHGCRKVAETNYSASVIDQLMEDEFLGADARQQLDYYPTVTREAFRNGGRITDLLLSGRLNSDLGYPALDPASDRVMVCGSQSFNDAIVAYLNKRGFVEGSSGEPAHFVIEKAFVEPPPRFAPARGENHG